MARPTRRDFLRGAMAAAGALTISPIQALPRAYGANAPDNGKFLVVINLFGGNDGVNTVIPAHLTPYTERRQNINLDPNYINPDTGVANSDIPLLDLDGRFRLHYQLNNLKTLWDTNDLHIVQKVGYPNRNLSHFTSMNIYSYGVRDISGNGDGRGWLGRFADAYCADPVEPLGVVSVGTGRRRDFEADTGEALVLNNVPSFDFDEDDNFRTDHELRLRVARSILDQEQAPGAGPGLTVFGTSRQAHELVERVQAGTAGWTDPNTYPDTTLGRRLKEVSRLLHGRQQFGTRVLYTGFGGFDTHADQLGRHESLMGQLDGALGAFVDDLKARNLWDDCVVMVISEFGRRNFENGSAGTDHGHGNNFMIAGGGVDGGRMTGDLLEADLIENYPDFNYDFREIYSDLIANHIGVPATPIFPESFNATGDINLLA